MTMMMMIMMIMIIKKKKIGNTKSTSCFLSMTK